MFEQMRQRLIEKAIRGQLVPQSDSEPVVEQIGDAPGDVPFAIPKKWKWIDFRKSVSTLASRSFQISSKEILSSGHFPVVSQSKTLIDGYHNDTNKVIPEIFLPFIVFGDHTKSVKLIDFPCIIGADGTKLLRPTDPNSLDVFYLYFVLQASSYNMRDRGYARHFQLLKNNPLPIPPVEEQRRIVAKLVPLFAEIDKAEKAYNELTGSLAEQYKLLILDQAMRGQLVPQLDSEPEVKQMGEATEEIPFSIPKKWKWVQIKDISLKITDGEHKTPHYRCDGGIPFVSVKNISSGYLDFQNTKFISEQDHEIFRKRCNPELGGIS